MNKQALTELEFLNEKIKDEKQKVYSKGVVLLPAITTLTCGALVSDRFGAIIGALTVITGLAVTTETLMQAKELQEKKGLPTENAYVKIKNIKNRK